LVVLRARIENALDDCRCHREILRWQGSVRG
jgi:hypothetical protein